MIQAALGAFKNNQLLRFASTPILGRLMRHVEQLVIAGDAIHAFEAGWASKPPMASNTDYRPPSLESVEKRDTRAGRMALHRTGAARHGATKRPTTRQPITCWATSECSAATKIPS